ncbi:pyridoxal phosphate-dependent aminotransferase [Nocardia vulneris]|uniref:pyridoxal phosphate-dependent aminotransferase n=1 Tax=Nocardia vulneris TaxID=1141657 RepID=UPI0030CB883A
MTAAPGPPPATRVANLASGQLFRLLSEARACAAIDLALGVPQEPPTPSAMIDAACAVLRGGQHHQYANPFGNPLLRKVIAESSATPADPETEITVTVGATEALHVAVLTVVDPGDEVILFEPIYDNFLSAIVLAGGIPRPVRLRAPQWRHDPAELRAAFGPRTRAIIVSTPNNPTGHMLSPAEWSEIAELCQRWNAIVISDEIYRGYVYDGNRHVCAADIPALRDRSFIVDSLSKSHAVCGWRIGYLRAAAPLTAAARRVHTAVCGGTAAPLQEAVARAAAADPHFPRPSIDLQAQRDRAVEVFAAFGFGCLAPDGGCYVMADITSVTDSDSETFSRHLLRHPGVLVVPGSYFRVNATGRDTFVRIAFNRPLQVFDDVEKRLGTAPLTPAPLRG